MTTRFVILCQPRTGSTLLHASLSGHPQILMHGEILNHRYHPRLPDEGYERLLAALNRSTHPAVGCNLHAFQPDRRWEGWRRWESAWDALADDPSIKVIHLERLDTLAQLASWKIADVLGWGEQPDVAQRPTVRIDPEELRWFRQWNRACYACRLSRLARHDVLQVTYESLSAQWEATMRTFQGFVGVEATGLRQAIRKSETRPLREIVENWDELQAVHHWPEPLMQ